MLDLEVAVDFLILKTTKKKFENSGTSDGFSFETVSPNNDHPKYLDGGHGLGVTLQASWSVSLLTIFTTYCIGAIHLWS